VTVGGIVQLQPGAEATAIESKPAIASGKASVTVTGEPSVAVVPAFETVRANVVAAPPTNGGECDLVTARSGASTVVVTGGLSTERGVFSVCARKRAEAWFVTLVPTGRLSIVTSKLN